MMRNGPLLGSSIMENGPALGLGYPINHIVGREFLVQLIGDKEYTQIAIPILIRDVVKLLIYRTAKAGNKQKITSKGVPLLLISCQKRSCCQKILTQVYTNM